MKLKQLSEAWKHKGHKFEHDRRYTSLMLCKDMDKIVSFGQQIPKIEMFITWDKKNSCPMKEPKKYNLVLGNERRNPLYGKQCRKYQKSKAEVLFDGFNVVDVVKPVFGSDYFRVRSTSLDINIHFIKRLITFNGIEIKTIQQLENKAELMPKVAEELYGTTVNCDHPMSHRADVVASSQTYCLKCSEFV